MSNDTLNLDKLRLSFFSMLTCDFGLPCTLKFCRNRWLIMCPLYSIVHPQENRLLPGFLAKTDQETCISVLLNVLEVKGVLFLLGECILRYLLSNVYKLNTNTEVLCAIPERHAVHRRGIQSYIIARDQLTCEVLDTRRHKRRLPQAKPYRHRWSSIQT